jgi:hypothetical protein
VTWAFAAVDKPRKIKADASKHTLPNVNQDGLDITTP